MMNLLKLKYYSPDSAEGNGEEKPLALDDARRVKVLSPGMMVFKRFVRNKLAIAGFIILVFMFLFSFVGPLFSPYSIAQLFTDEDAYEWKNYATGKYNTDPRYITTEGVKFDSSARTAMLLALSNTYKSKQMAAGDIVEFSTKDKTYFLTVIDPDKKAPTYLINSFVQIAHTMRGKITELDAEFDTEEFRKVLEETGMNKRASGLKLTAGDVEVTVVGNFPEYSYQIAGDPETLVTYNSYITLDQEYKKYESSFDFAVLAEESLRAGADSFEFDGKTFSLDVSGEEAVVSADGKEVMMISDIVFGSAQVGTTLTADFYVNASEAIRANNQTFSFESSSGEKLEARINLVNGNYYLETQQKSQLLLVNRAPSDPHPLGTDLHGMDVLTRLMYGGRVSLMVGFVVVFFETVLGVIIGGISGYFGGWVDTLLMRLVDLVNAIPFYPVVIITGAIFDHMRVPSVTRLFLLMVVLGILGWTGIARVVRGQILSLREQDFMVATEATGIRTSRRIFRHLVPNVMPLLIVNATMGLGGIILTEATLGFLGLGVKYPMVSWGAIINEATDMYVMTTAWWIWIPAGLFILLTVLGFNFVGDGLRDAFDPKMKR